MKIRVTNLESKSGLATADAIASKTIYVNDTPVGPEESVEVVADSVFVSSVKEPVE